MLVKLAAITPNAEDICIRAARTCYNSKSSTEEAGRKLLKNIIRKGHTSVLEHAQATFFVRGISRTCSHQLVRHRIGCGYSQRSQRYVVEDNYHFVIPAKINSSGTATRDVYLAAMEQSKKAYNELLKLGIAKEDARFVLPNAWGTELFVSMNFRALLHFLELRLDRRAQWEIREVAKKMLFKIVEKAPTVFGDFYNENMEGQDVC